MIDTKILKLDGSPEDGLKIQYAAKVLKEGGTVAFPTETVYGIGANALDKNAIAKIFSAKGRPSDNPLIVHVADINDLKKLTRNVDAEVFILMEKFWPGPISFVLPKSDIIPLEITAGLDTVAIRMPSHNIALELIKMAGIPIAAPSANTSGKPSPTNAQHVIDDLYGKVDVIIDGGNCQVGLESTVVDVTNIPPVILRPGGVTKEQLAEAFGEILIKNLYTNDDEVNIPKAPGMKYRHYSPKAGIVVVLGDDDSLVSEKVLELAMENVKMGKKIGIMGTEKNIKNYKDYRAFSMGDINSPKEIAENLFRILREFDNTDVDLIIAEGIKTEGIGAAVMNRLCKAAGYNLVYAKGE